MATAVVLGGVAVAALTAAVTVVAGSVTTGQGAPSAAQVDLPPVVPEGRGLTGDEAAAALAPFAPERLQCRPAGCERWWIEGHVARAAPARLQDDLVLAIDDRLAAIDPWTGAERWTVPLAELQPAPETGWELRAGELALTADEDDVVAWAPRGFVQLRDADGSERWSVTLPETRRLWSAELADQNVLVSSEVNSAGGPIEVVTAYDRRHGAVRWRQRVRWVYANGADGALVRSRDDRVALLDPSSGHVALDLDVEDPRWVRSLGAFFAARVDAHAVLLFDRTSGELTRRLEDVAAIADLEDGDGGIAVLIAGRHDDTGSSRPTTVMAVSGDGTTRWERSLGCCPSLVTSPPGTVAARISGDAPPLALAAEDGSELTPPAWEPAGRLQWVSDDLLFVADVDTPMVLDRRGSRIVLDHEPARVLSVDPLVVVSSSGLLGIDQAAAAPAIQPAPKEAAQREGRALAHGAAALSQAVRRR